jgi:hypothetical protein
MANNRTGPDYLDSPKEYRQKSIRGWKKAFTPIEQLKKKKKKKK